MATKINYCDETWNPVCGCTKCSPGCDNCYAEVMARRLAGMGQEKYQAVTGYVGEWTHWLGDVYCDEKALDKPLHWRKPRRILVPSMGDLFHEKVPFEFIDKVMFTIYKSYKMGHTFLILTKRAKRMLKYFSGNVDGRILKLFRLTDSRYTSKHRLTDSVNLLPRVHLGVTICNQKEADEILPIALQIPGFDWISIEPMLEDIYIKQAGCDSCQHTGYVETHPDENGGHAKCYDCGGMGSWVPPEIDWVVVGCESGTNRRLCKPEWIRDIVDQCQESETPVFVKQMEVGGKVVHELKDMPAWAVQQELI